MYYLIYTPHHPRPYLTSVSFVAHDFANWGCRITRHANTSPYIIEIRFQEAKPRPANHRVKLMELWAQEVLTRKHQRTPCPITEASLPEARKARASLFAQDFVCSLSTLESPFIAPKPLYNDPLPLPAYPLALVARYTRLLHRCAYTSHAVSPDPEVPIADQVALEFRFEKELRREQLQRALTEAVSKREGRMGRVEKCRETGVTRVLMWVDVGDLVAGECGKEEAEGEAVPVYEEGGWVWPPSYEECEGGVDVRSL
ncbi:hypothetical protein C7974DRAFT_72883 [Boeremia exigua]|uniref:uncharacterized protein n=1 Tax=Boeremia exigua TaxID=749465 RepID=UPI001E8DD9F2|nr:uncharacterized protein C7974DRAFT_72883 [Boeremia exigua]KAH6614211.1 hypothetical protein C7974DRAFT_72883 [Boeremia exigua]